MGEARSQRLRLKRFALAAVTCAMWIGFGLYIDALGLYRLELVGIHIPLSFVAGGIVVSNIVFFVLIASGFNQRFDEPSLTLPMMLTATFWAILFAGGTAEARAIALVAFMLIFLFGIFKLHARQFAVCWLYAVGGYVAIVWLTLPASPPLALLRLELMYAALLATVLFWVAYFGYYVGRLRESLHARNAELSGALGLVEELAAHDDLTGLYNRRFVMGALAREQQRHARHGTPFSILLLDLDRFKTVNDNHGHPAGDEVLKAFVRRVTDAVRDIDLVGSGSDNVESDTFGRFGGEEFVVVLPDTPLEGAKRVAERVRAATAAQPFETAAGPIRVTTSVGIAEFQAGESIRDILERVDKALYAAKHAGRDAIACAPTEPDGTPMVVAPS